MEKKCMKWQEFYFVNFENYYFFNAIILEFFFQELFKKYLLQS